jgi:hypothetical protein
MRKAVVTDKGTEIVEYTGAELEEYNNAQPQRDADRIASKLSSCLKILRHGDSL